LKTENWKSISADSAPPGVYTPNMSDDDKYSWKGKLIKGADPRVEIRKSFKFNKSGAYYCQTLISIRLNSKEQPNILMSTNGKIAMSFDDLKDMNNAIEEAINKLKEI